MADEAHTQQDRNLRLATPLGDDVLLPVRLQTEEGISTLFSLEMELVSRQPDIDFNDIVGKNVTIGLKTMEGERYWNGTVRRFRQGDTTLEFTRYYAEVVPWLWLLTQSSDCRIFQDKSVPDIVKQVFDDHGCPDYADRLDGSYEPRVYCVQYRETAFAFVSRLLEEEGIHYFFEHEDGRHVLVLADSPNGNKPCPERKEARFNPHRRTVLGDEMLHALTWQQQVHATKVALRDFNFETPNTDLTAQREDTESDLKLEIYDYPGEYADGEEGKRYARLRLEERAALAFVLNGSSSCRGFTPGFTVEVKEHPRKDINQALLLTHVRHTVSEMGGYLPGWQGPSEFAYGNEFVAIPHKTPFRPARVTPRPHVLGSQTAIVVGPASEEIHTDKYGRVKIRFHWDHESGMDDTCSCWVRVSQGWAGKNWGAMFLPRIGQEVIVDFIEGDPDQPIITGRVYNAEAMPPFTLPDDKTISGFKTRSSKSAGTDNLNTLHFEDRIGEEQVFLQAERNLDVRVKGDRYETVGNNRHLGVKKDKFEYVENNRHEKVDADHIEEIGKDLHSKVTGKQAVKIGGSLSVSVGGDVIEKFSANHAEETGQTWAVKGLNARIEASTGIEFKCGGSSIVLTPAAIFIMGGPLVNINSGSGPPVTPPPANAVSPAAPEEPEEADTADPTAQAEMQAAQFEKGKGEYDSTKLKPHKPPKEGEESEKKSWIEIELFDEDDNPVAGARYEIVLPDGETVASGTLDEKGFARVDGIDPGECKVCFPELDEEAWEPA